MRVMKKTMKKRVVILAVAVALFVAAPASAALWWDPGDPGSTHQEWTFDDADNPAAPGVDENPFGTASATISSGGYSPEPVWHADWLGRQGVWEADELEAYLQIPNQPIPNEYKEIWVELGFYGTIRNLTVAAPAGTTRVDILAVEVVEVGNGWNKLAVGWRIEPNPEWENPCINFDGVGDVDYVIIDTICIPEPVTICLLGLGCLLLRRKRTS